MREPEEPVTKAGSGLPLVVLHGILMNGEEQKTIIAPHFPGQRIIAPDLLGHGSNIPMKHYHSTDETARDLLKGVEAPKYNILGFSYGGLVATRMAYLAPERVNRIILVSTFAYRGRTPLKRLFYSKAVPKAIRDTRVYGLATVGYFARLRFRLTQPKSIEMFKRILANSRAHVPEIFQALYDHDGRSWLPEVTTPTLILAGAKDWLVPPIHAQILSRLLPNSQLSIIAGASHNPFEKSGEAARLCEAFLQEDP
jgi:3-oxoadipate enol-lactonase